MRETGTTFPDVMLLPQIARLYCVTIDDLYRERASVYANYAQRLFSVYESTGKNEDFLRADEEFSRLFSSGDYSANDLRTHGILYHYMMNRCRKRALEIFDHVIAIDDPAEAKTVRQTRQQKLMLRCQVGEGEACVREQQAVIDAGSDSLDDHVLLLSALFFTGEYQRCLDFFRACIEKFPDESLLYVYGGDACKQLGQTGEAFRLWDRALELDESMYDARFSKAFYYEETGEYASAYRIWQDITQRLKKDGFEYELDFPLSRAEECRKKM